jgi:hypothetical protein
VSLTDEKRRFELTTDELIDEIGRSLALLEMALSRREVEQVLYAMLRHSLRYNESLGKALWCVTGLSDHP